MTRLLITGGSSYLGQHLVPIANKSFDVVYTTFQNNPLQLSSGVQLDLRDETAVLRLVAQVKPDIIIHLVGSNRPQDMADVIRRGTQAITKAAVQQQARLIHLSTDSIFNGENAPYGETAVPTPINTYGRAKADAETIAAQHPNYAIVRTSLIYGLEIMDHGTSWMVKALQAGEPVTLFSNQLRNPVWVKTLCDACLELANHTYIGIINVAGSQLLTRAEFGLKMLDWWQIQQRDTLTIAATTGNRWPLNCELNLSLVSSLLSTPLPGVDAVLKQTVRHSDPAANTGH